jgi:hypothetical protein
LTNSCKSDHNEEGNDPNLQNKMRRRGDNNKHQGNPKTGKDGSKKNAIGQYLS